MPELYSKVLQICEDFHGHAQKVFQSFRPPHRKKIMPSVQFTRLHPNGSDPCIVASKITHWCAHDGGSKVYIDGQGFHVSERPDQVKALVDAALLQLGGAK